MTTYAFQTAPETWVEILGASVDLPGRTVSQAWVEGLSPSERTALDFVAVTPTAAPTLPPGLTATRSVVDHAGAPRQAWSIAHITDGALAAGWVVAVNAARDAKIDGGFTHAGGVYQSRQTDRENVGVLGQQAQLAVLGGAEAGDLRWHGGATDFAWILADNSTVTLDAPAMVALFLAGVAFKTALTFAARAKKDWLLDPARTRAELLAFDLAADWPA